MKEGICMDANVVSYIKGAKSAKTILKSSKINELDNMEEHTKEYLDDSINILKLGTYTAIINIVTVTLSLITVLIMVLTIIS